MGIRQLKWSNLLKLTELEFQPDFPEKLNVSDEVLQVISWLTGTTGFDRRLLRCTQQGALLVAKPWSILTSVAVHETTTVQSTEIQIVMAAANNGVLIASTTQIIKVGFRRVTGGDISWVYIPPASYYWYPFSTYSVSHRPAPYTSGTVSLIGITAFKQ